MSFEDLTRARFSCRHYEDRPVEDDVLARVIEAGRIAPSACNKHPTRIKVCTSKDDLARAALACPRFERNGSIFGAPAIIIACAVSSLPKLTPAAIPSGRLWIAMAVTNSNTLSRLALR